MKVLRESQRPKAFLLHLVRGLSVAVCLGAPVAEAGGKDEGLINSGELSLGGSKNVMLGLNKAVIINLPADAHDILVADPSIADALDRTSRRIYMFGKKVGQNPPRNSSGLRRSIAVRRYPAPWTERAARDPVPGFAISHPRITRLPGPAAPCKGRLCPAPCRRTADRKIA